MLDTSNKKMYCTSAFLSSLVPNLFATNHVSEEEPFRVRAGTVLSANSQTEIVTAQDFSLDYLQQTHHRLKLEVCEIQSRLFTSNNMVNTSTWIKEITLATDHHCCNVELEAEKEGLVLKVKRTVSVGEPLLMWFGEKFRAILDIPFLTSCHIEENLTYKCHLCDRTFDEPNPLKLHIALKCDKLTINFLWQSLAVQYSKPSFLMSSILTDSNSFPYPHINFQLSQTPNMHYSDFVPKFMNPLLPSANLESTLHRRSTPDLMNSEYSESLRKLMIVTSAAETFSSAMERQFKLKSNSLRKPSGRLSAFHLVSDCSLNSVTDYSMENVELGYTSEDNRIPVPDPLILENQAGSNGKTNDGKYQCVICHKRYSRKYGLKIHFRTHTGYKPLHCKYCGRAFGDPSNLNKHVRLHLNSENARYKCKYCDEGMVRRRDLERHIQKKHSAD